MSMENIVKCLLRLADVADELTKLFVAAALLLFVYYLVMGIDDVVCMKILDEILIARDTEFIIPHGSITT